MGTRNCSTLLALVLAGGLGCSETPAGGSGEKTPRPSATTMLDPPGVAPGDPSVLALGDPKAVNVDRFVTSSGCAMCHSNSPQATAMRDEKARPIAPFDLWQGTMMANSSRDPFWRAMVSAEMARTPAIADAIEAKCLRCHAPMASEAAHAKGREPRLADLHDSRSELNQVAIDGVSCALCHQIDPKNLDQRDSWSGGFAVGDDRVIYGPHRSPAPGPMQNHVAYTPVYGDHVLESKTCATCHTLFTHSFDESGSPIEGASLPEQTAFLEWENSVFSGANGGGKTCQDCHQPKTSEDGEPIETRIARSPPGGDFNIAERSPFGRHLVVGGNTVVPAILKAERAILRPQASDAAFDATIEMARKRLQNTASVAVGEVKQSGGTLAFDVTVSVRTGHKFPTGFPSRRAWLHVRVLDAVGNVLFVSGASEGQGRITDHTGALLDVEKANGGWEPHHDVISRSDEVQIYESVMGSGGGHTSSLLRATQYVKDNRLLPLGYSDAHEYHRHTQPRGVTDDRDFVAGSDTVHYRVALAAPAARVEALLVYQPLGARFLRDLFQVGTPEVAAFRTMYDRADVTPVELAASTVDL